MCIAVPLLAATGNRTLALGVTAVSGLTEPFGAFLGVAFLRQFADPTWLAVALNALLCMTGGIMMAISRSELLPQAYAHAGIRTVVPGFVMGALLITGTLMLF